VILKASHFGKRGERIILFYCLGNSREKIDLGEYRDFFFTNVKRKKRRGEERVCVSFLSRAVESRFATVKNFSRTLLFER